VNLKRGGGGGSGKNHCGIEIGVEMGH